MKNVAFDWAMHLHENMQICDMHEEGGGEA